MRNEASGTIRAGFLVAGCLGVAFAGDGNEWPQFRGPGGSGFTQGTIRRGVPTEWDTTKNVAWRIDVPGLGWSSPIVWGNRVFLTTAVDAQGTEQPEGGFYLGKGRGGRGEHRWLVLAYDLNTGEKLWEHQVHRAVPPRTHLKSSYASATPVTDGERVHAWFGVCGVLVALNAANGDEVWSFSEPPRKSRENWGFGSSPVMHGGRVYLVHDNEEAAYVAAFDAPTGKEIWRVKRPPETNWSTPLVWKNEQRTELVVAATGGVTSYDLNGRPLWELRGMSQITVPNPVAGNGMVYVGSGFIADEQQPLYAIRPGAAGDISLKEGETKNRYVAWLEQRAAPYVPSFLVAGKYLYVIKDNGRLSCYDAVTGASVYQERLRGHFTASPVMCGDRLFFLNERGDTHVVQSGPTFKLLATNTLERLCLATPAVAGDRLLIRTSSRLYCIESSSPTSAHLPSMSDPSRDDGRQHSSPLGGIVGGAIRKEPKASPFLAEAKAPLLRQRQGLRRSRIRVFQTDIYASCVDVEEGGRGGASALPPWGGSWGGNKKETQGEPVSRRSEGPSPSAKARVAAQPH